MSNTPDKPVRRSNRLRNMEPEFHGLDESDRTPKTSPSLKHRTPKQYYSGDECIENSKGIGDCSMDFGPREGEGKHMIENYEGALSSHSRPVTPKTNPLIYYHNQSSEEDEDCIPEGGMNYYNYPEVQNNYDCHEPILSNSNHASVKSSFAKALHRNPILFFVFICFIALICIALYRYYINPPGWLKSTNCESEINSMQKSFPSTDEKLWALVAHAEKSSDMFAVLLVHDNRDSAATCLANRVVENIICARRQSFTNVAKIDGRNVMKDGHFIEWLRLKLENQNTFVLTHLEDVPPMAAQDLHYILDFYSPLVPGGVYVLTLNLPNLKEMNSPYKAVEVFLEKKWSGHMKEANVDALITRITNFVAVVSEDSDNCER